MSATPAVLAVQEQTSPAFDGDGSRSNASRRRRGGDSYDDIEPLFCKLTAITTRGAQYEAVRREVIDRCLPLAEHIARRFAGRGEAFEDLLQVARLGLVHAVDRFDVERGSSFLSFAVPTIMGEVRRHFRDNTWSVRVPRRVKEIQLTLGPAIETLSQRLGRIPRIDEIAAELHIDLGDATQGLIAGNAYQTSSIDAVVAEEGDRATVSRLESLGVEEQSYQWVEDYLAVKPLLAELAPRERQVLVMRFFESQTQTQIAEQLGVSQMHVSRILARTLAWLRQEALRD